MNVGSILVVARDSQASVRWVTELEALGHAVVAAAPPGAISVLQDGGIDIVVIDQDDEHGHILELARDIEVLPDAPSIVFVSGSVAAPEVSVRIGAAEFLPKPCEVTEVIAAIERLLGRLRPVRTIEDEPTGPRHFG